MKGAIDFRMRPIGLAPMTADITRLYLGKMGLKPTESFEKQSLPLLLVEMEAAGIEKGVIALRSGSTRPGYYSPDNADIARMVKEYPDRFVGFGSVDTSDLGEALDEIDRVAELGLSGVTVEPSTMRVPMRFDDKRLYPVYERVQKRGLPLLTAMSALLGPYMDDLRPEWVDRVATDFPGLNIVIAHGLWPYVREALGLAYKQSNVFLIPGQYLHYRFPGWRDWVEAANSQVRGQLLFGSIYPNCNPLVELMAIVDNLGFDEAAKHDYLQGNARRVLNLPQ